MAFFKNRNAKRWERNGFRVYQAKRQSMELMILACNSGLIHVETLIAFKENGELPLDAVDALKGTLLEVKAVKLHNKYINFGSNELLNP